MILLSSLMIIGIFSSAVCAESIDPLYQEIINAVSSVLRGGTSAPFSDEDYSIMFRLNANSSAAGQLGYALIDLDKDGTNELFFGENYPDTSETILYDMYTIQNGQLVHVFDGWDRNRYYISTDGSILNRGSGSAFESAMSYYLYHQGTSTYVYSLIYNALQNSSAPWFISCSDLYDVSNAKPISEADANVINGHYTFELLNLQSFE